MYTNIDYQIVAELSEKSDENRRHDSTSQGAGGDGHRPPLGVFVLAVCGLPAYSIWKQKYTQLTASAMVVVLNVVSMIFQQLSLLYHLS